MVFNDDIRLWWIAIYVAVCGKRRRCIGTFKLLYSDLLSTIPSVMWYWHHSHSVQSNPEGLSHEGRASLVSEPRKRVSRPDMTSSTVHMHRENRADDWWTAHSPTKIDGQVRDRDVKMSTTKSGQTISPHMNSPNGYWWYLSIIRIITYGTYQISGFRL